MAVLRPTPGRASSAARSSGTSPPCRSTSRVQVLMNVAGLGVEQADGLDVLLQSVLAQREHVRRRADFLNRLRGGLVDALVGRLRREDHGDQELEGIAVVQFGGRVGVGRAQALEDFPAFTAVHGLPGVRQALAGGATGSSRTAARCSRRALMRFLAAIIEPQPHEGAGRKYRQQEAAVVVDQRAATARARPRRT